MYDAAVGAEADFRYKLKYNTLRFRTLTGATVIIESHIKQMYDKSNVRNSHFRAPFKLSPAMHYEAKAN